MRLTSAELFVVPLLAMFCLSACENPPSSEGDGDGDETAGDGDGDGDGDDGPTIICEPGETRCKEGETGTLELCAPTGLKWDEVPCEGYEQCETITVEGGESESRCAGPCEMLEGSPSSEGCSFYTTSMLQTSLPPNVEEPPDAIIVSNPQSVDATVELRWVPEGSNIEQLDADEGGPFTIPPGETHTFKLDPALTDYAVNGVATSMYRSGSVYHVVSNLPVVAYLHAPYEEQNTNASTLLLPENVLSGDYIIYNHTAWQAPNYFIVIAMEDQTTVTWRPSVETAGDWLPLPFVEAGESGTQLLNRFDNMRIDTSKKYDRPKCEQDLSGTVIEADKPIWVVSAVQGLRLPWCSSQLVPGCPQVQDALCDGGSDFSMEQNLPLEYWGRHYVGPHSPVRGGEFHNWRVYSGEDDVTVTVTGLQTPTELHFDNRGDWEEFDVPSGTNLEFSGNGVFMPVQYVVGHYVTDYVDADGHKIGSPAMIQMVPTAQFLDRYVFVTGVGYTHHYVQVIREAGASDVLLDDTPVAGWESVGDWEVATVLIEEGAHEIHGDDSFGILQYGYSPHETGVVTSAGYGYMGGMKAEVIFIP